MREVKLEEYLPEFMRPFAELTEALKAENPEFRRIWAETERIHQNRFLSTADEEGLSRLERELKLLIREDDTAESRRMRIKGHLTGDLPYTAAKLRETLDAVLGKSDRYVLTIDHETYTVTVGVKLAAHKLKENVGEFVREMLPENMQLIVYLVYNRWYQLEGFRWDDLETETWEQLYSDQKYQKGF